MQVFLCCLNQASTFLHFLFLSSTSFIRPESEWKVQLQQQSAHLPQLIQLQLCCNGSQTKGRWCTSRGDETKTVKLSCNPFVRQKSDLIRERAAEADAIQTVLKLIVMRHE